MAGRIGFANLAGVASGTAAKTMIQLVAAANHAVNLKATFAKARKIKQVGIGFKGTSATGEPITVKLIRQTTAGTMSALTLVKADDSGADSFDTTGQHTATAEPTTGSVLATLPPCHPQTSYIWEPPFDAPVMVGAGDRMGLVVTAATDVNFDGFVMFEE